MATKKKYKRKPRIVKILPIDSPVKGNDKDLDKKRSALPCGIRISKTGHRYRETRFNKCDKNLKTKL